MPNLITFPTIPLRGYQLLLWRHMEGNTDNKRSIQIWHRRAGKDLLDLQIMAKEAVIRPHNYWFILPFYSQVRKAIWEGRTKEGRPYLSFFPDELIKRKNNQEMYIEYVNGSVIRFLGGDNPDSLVGAGPRGIVISEWALQRPSLWTYLEPMLLENKGWCLFNSTPRGDNHCKQTFDNYNKPDSGNYASLLTVKDTDIVSEAEIAKLRNDGWAEELIQQEFYCSFAGNRLGAYYGDIMAALERGGKITTCPLDETALVHTFWDLGLSDMTSIWFVQFIGREIRLIDYHEDHNKRVSDYADFLINTKQYKYGSHNIPHDGAKRDVELLKSYQQLLTDAGLNNVKVHERTPSLYSSIQQVRSLLSRCIFDAERCKDGIWCLKNYRRAYDEDRKTFKDVPEHDLASHGADAFRLIAEVQDRYNPAVIRGGSRTGFNFKRL